MKALVVAAALLCCDAALVQHRLWKTYLNFHNTDPAVLRISKPEINLVETYNTVTIPKEVPESVPVSRVPSPVLIKRLDAPHIDEEEFLLDEQDPAHRKSPVPVPVPVLLSGKLVESPKEPPVSAPGKDLASDVPVNYQQSASSSVSLPIMVVAAVPEPLEAPEPPMPSITVPFVGGQFHSQDELKQYSFGHWGGLSTRVETKDALGRTHGSFAYVNPLGDVHVRKYAAAPSMGFKVAASDLPIDTPEVATLKAAHERAHLNFLSLREEVI
ncbi:uncharacterized protein LOC126984211 [Eriocheir sinensis]|uniref:uncharacterized protein LOC126984211 n=1 Tax=Eriocheir sinensis TaxID=95602 RepID=UPI0021C7CD63|nr:uncharacterized protein LOC126984211 [Eriocheir sinensis]